MFTVLNHIFAHLWGVGGFSLPSSPIRPARPWALRFCLIMFERTSPGVFTSASNQHLKRQSAGFPEIHELLVMQTPSFRRRKDVLN
jgi:hypothetical protein